MHLMISDHRYTHESPNTRLLPIAPRFLAHHLRLQSHRYSTLVLTARDDEVRALLSYRAPRALIDADALFARREMM